MSIKDRIKAILLKFEDIQVPTYTLSNGTVVSIDKLAEGGMVLLTDGTVPAAQDWTLDDGTVITTDVNGMIVKLVAPMQMETMSLLDGTAIAITKLEVGGDVLINGEPAKEGTYTLSDNTVITVDAAGKIASVTAPVIEEQIDYSKITKEDFDALKAKFEGGIPDAMAMWAMTRALMENNFGWQLRQTQVEQVTNDALAAYKQNYAAETTKLQNENKSLRELFAEVLEVVKEIAGEPAVETPEKKTRFSFQEPGKKYTQLERMAKAAERVKQN